MKVHARWGQGSDRLDFSMATLFDNNADVAELADAHDSGSSARNSVEVQVLSSAPSIKVVRESALRFHLGGLTYLDWNRL